jgi:hypothetical protein
VEVERDTAGAAQPSEPILQIGIDQKIEVILKELSQAIY